jgi:glycolate oxidase FAD binding subunit
MEMIRPSNAHELAGALLAASSAGRSIALRGSGSKDAMGGPVPDAAVDLRLDGLSGVLQYEPHDLTIQVAAGTPWREFTATLAQQGQMLPLDPPCAATATVGGVVAANCSGPRRRYFGSARDMVIGMTIATLDGNLVQTGGMVVKNVAGLDMQKALTGSFGTLAAIASVNFKLAPLPELSRTFVFAFQTAADCLAARQRVLTSRLQPAAVDILNPRAARLTGWDVFLLAVRAGGSKAVLARYARELGGATVLEGEKEDAFWQAVQEFAPLFMSQGVDQAPGRAVVRVGHMLAELGDVLDSAPGACIARAGNGVSYLAFDGLDALQAWMSATQTKPWSRVVEWSSAEVRDKADLWPTAGEDFDLMKRLKLLFDPQHVLNPGRLYGHI